MRESGKSKLNTNQQSFMSRSIDNFGQANKKFYLSNKEIKMRKDSLSKNNSIKEQLSSWQKADELLRCINDLEIKKGVKLDQKYGGDGIKRNYF